MEGPEDPERALAERISAMYGDRLPAEVLAGIAPAFDRQAALGIYLTGEAAEPGGAVFGALEVCPRVLGLDRGPLDRQVEVSVLPFGLPERRGAAWCGWVKSADRQPRFAPEADGIATLIDAFACSSAEMPAARLVIAGRRVIPPVPSPGGATPASTLPTQNVEFSAR